MTSFVLDYIYHRVLRQIKEQTSLDGFCAHKQSILNQIFDVSCLFCLQREQSKKDHKDEDSTLTSDWSLIKHELDPLKGPSLSKYQITYFTDMILEKLYERFMEGCYAEFNLNHRTVATFAAFDVAMKHFLIDFDPILLAITKNQLPLSMQMMENLNQLVSGGDGDSEGLYFDEASRISSQPTTMQSKEDHIEGIIAGGMKATEIEAMAVEGIILSQESFNSAMTSSSAGSSSKQSPINEEEREKKNIQTDVNYSAGHGVFVKPKARRGPPKKKSTKDRRAKKTVRKYAQKMDEGPIEALSSTDETEEWWKMFNAWIQYKEVKGTYKVANSSDNEEEIAVEKWLQEEQSKLDFYFINDPERYELLAERFIIAMLEDDQEMVVEGDGCSSFSNSK